MARGDARAEVRDCAFAYTWGEGGVLGGEKWVDYEMEVVSLYKGRIYFSAGCLPVDDSSMHVIMLGYMCISFTPKLYPELLYHNLPSGQIQSADFATKFGQMPGSRRSR